jgi:hypothetical protein
VQGGRRLGPGSDLGDAAPDIGIVQIMLGSVVDLTYALEPELWRRYSAIVLQGLRARPDPPAPLDVPALPFEQFEAAMVDAHTPRARRR